MNHIQLPKRYSLDALPTSTLSRLKKLGGVLVFEALDHLWQSILRFALNVNRNAGRMTFADQGISFGARSRLNW